MSDNIKFTIADNEDIYSSNKMNTQEKKTQNIVKKNFEEKILKYLTSNKIKLYILTPCFGSVCYVNYINSLMLTVELFRKFNVPLKLEFCKSDSLVSRARNNLIARAMSDPECTHVLFIDNDISWDPADIFKLLISEKDLIGGIYPLKNYNWEKLIKDPITHLIRMWFNHLSKRRMIRNCPDY